MKRYSASMVLLVVFVSGCSKSTLIDTSSVTGIAEEILAGIADGEAKAVYEKHFSDKLKGKMPLKTWLAEADLYRSKLGTVKSVERVWLEGGQSGAMETADSYEGAFQFRVEWESDSGVLTLNMTRPKEGGGDWKVVSLQIQSKAIDQARARLRAQEALKDQPDGSTAAPE